MLARTVNSDGRVRLSVSKERSIKTFFFLAFYLIGSLLLIYISHNKDYVGLVIGYLNAGLAALTIICIVHIRLLGGYRIILSQNSIVRLAGRKKSWAAWKSLGMFEPIDDIGALLNAKIIGTDVSEDLKGEQVFQVCLAISRDEMYELMKELNTYCSRANSIDAKQTEELKTRI